MMSEPNGARLAHAVAIRQEQIVAALQSAGAARDGVLLGDSLLPRWDRLTIICHLRYGGIASRRMTIEALAGKPTSFYPEGRSHQRPTTLRVNDGESEVDVISALEQASSQLDGTWERVDAEQWQTMVHEPPDNEDLGSISLWTLALLRLTEVEVHGHDLNLGLSAWSTTFVDAALPMRLRWLPARRSNHQEADTTINGRWALAATDGPTFVVEARGADVEVTSGETEAGADVVIAGTAQQLLAFILGREKLTGMDVRGKFDLAHAFLEAFPAP